MAKIPLKVWIDKVIASKIYDNNWSFDDLRGKAETEVETRSEHDKDDPRFLLFVDDLHDRLVKLHAQRLRELISKHEESSIHAARRNDPWTRRDKAIHSNMVTFGIYEILDCIDLVAMTHMDYRPEVAQLAASQRVELKGKDGKTRHHHHKVFLLDEELKARMVKKTGRTWRSLRKIIAELEKIGILKRIGRIGSHWLWSVGYSWSRSDGMVGSVSWLNKERHSGALRQFRPYQRTTVESHSMDEDLGKVVGSGCQPETPHAASEAR